MSSRVALAVLLVLTACGEPSNPPADHGMATGDGIAQWRGGSLTFEELEAEARIRLPRTPEATDLETVVAGYRRVAMEIAARSLLLKDEETESRVREDWGPQLAVLEAQAIAQVFINSRLPWSPLTHADLESYYGSHPEEFQQQERRRVLHIFRRDRPGVVTLDALAELRRRAGSGERFEDLAVESDSETRLLGGSLGWVERGVLPPPLERVVFSLPAGQVSEPIRVDGGGILLLVSDIQPAEHFSLDDVRSELAERLRQERLAALIDEYLGGDTPSTDAGDEIGTILGGSAPEDAVLSIGGVELSAADFRLIFAERMAIGGRPVDAVRFFRTVERSLRLAERAAAEGFPGTTSEQQRLEEALRQGRDAYFAAKLLEVAVWRLIDAEEDAVRAFFEHNIERYMSPLGLNLRMLVIEDLHDSERSMSRLEELRRQSESGGTIDLTSAATELGGSVTDLGWVDFSSLQTLPQKIQVYLFEVTGTGFTIPFQLGESLRMIEVVERRDPAPLSFTDARETVRKDFFARHGQDLYRRVLDETLAGEEFRLDEDALRARLWPADSADVTSHQ